MSREVRVSLAAALVIVLAVAAVWQVGAVREDRADAAERADLGAPVTDRQSPTDYDGDGIGDATDVCPTRPETTNDFRDGDGCPDAVLTTGAS